MSNITFQTDTTGLFFPVASSLFLYGISQILKSSHLTEGVVCSLTGLLGSGMLMSYMDYRPAAQNSALISTFSLGALAVMGKGFADLKYFYYGVAPGETSKKLLAFGLTNIFFATLLFRNYPVRY